MEMMEIYWILKLNNFKDLLLGFTIIVTVMTLLGIPFTGMFFENNSIHKYKVLFLEACLALLMMSLMAINTFIPSTKQYLTMVGGNFLTTNDKVITTTEKGFELLDQYLDDKLMGATNDTKPKTNN